MTATSDLLTIPGVGPAFVMAFEELGVRQVRELVGRDPNRLYVRLCELRGAHQDRCVLYQFRCAVHFAETPRPEPELLKWWNWKGRVHQNEGATA